VAAEGAFSRGDSGRGPRRLSEAQLERLHAGLVKLASMDETVLAALVEHVVAGDQPDSS
jgi:hypothetical protein